MSEHKTFLGKLLAFDFAGIWADIKGWFKQQWDAADHKVLDASVNFTQFVKEQLESGELNLIVSMTKTTTDDEILAFLKDNIVTVLSSEVLIKDITPESTTDEIKAAFNKVLNEFNIMSDEDKQQLYTSIGANLYRLYMDVKAGKKVTFGTAAALIEAAFKIS